MLHDAEQTIGPESQTARTLARAISERMQRHEDRETDPNGACDEH
jgi:hypothetical protein